MTIDPTTMAPEAATAKRVAAVIYNPVKVDLEKLRAAISSDTGQWGEPLWLETSEEDPGGAVAAKAVDQGVDVVIAAGGDGTVRAVAEALRGKGIPLALVPSGTGNLLARNLELILDDLPGSISAALNGTDRAIDMGVIELEREDGSRETRSFLVMAGLGIDAKMIENMNEDLKKRVGWLAYIDAIRRAMRDSSQLHLRFRLDDGQAKRIHAHTLIVGNCGTLPASMLLMPDAVIDDGLFDIAFLRPKGFIGWVQIWWKVAWENGIIRKTKVGRKLLGDDKEVRALQYDTAAAITVRLNDAETVELDGDSLGQIVAFKAWIDPLALKVRMPSAAHSTGSENDDV